MSNNAVSVHPFDFENEVRLHLAAACKWQSHYSHTTLVCVEDRAALESVTKALSENESRELTTPEVSELAAAVVSYMAAHRSPNQPATATGGRARMNDARGIPELRTDNEVAAMVRLFEERLAEIALARLGYDSARANRATVLV